MTSNYHITALGSRTSIGLNSHSTIASIRAGIDQFSEHSELNDMNDEPLILAMDHLLPKTKYGEERLLILLLAVLKEIMVELKSFNSSFEKLPIFLGLPEYRPGWKEKNSEDFIARFQNEINNSSLILHSYYPYGHASGALALNALIEHLEHENIHTGLVVALDSYINPDTLDWLERNKQLSNSKNRGAFIPGEAACGVAISKSIAVNHYKYKNYGLVQGLGIGIEKHRIRSNELCLGKGLTDAIEKATISIEKSSKKIEGIICDINGERYRSEEWGFTLLNFSSLFIDPTNYEMPTSCLGDVGAASCILYLILASKSYENNWSKGTNYLIWTSSECGYRGAVYLDFSAIKR